MLHCHEATARYFVAKVQGEVFACFHAVTIKHHNSMLNLLFGVSCLFLPTGIEI
jgi:hypothetical protein